MDESTESFLQDFVWSDEFYEEVVAKLEDPNETADMGCTLLHVAARSYENNYRIVQLLLERGADVNRDSIFGITPLHFAVASRKRRAVVAFIEAGASINSKDFLGRTPLHYAIGARWRFPPTPDLNTECDMWIVEKLLRHPEIDINATDNVGNTPLMYAVKQQNSLAVTSLLKIGANPNIPNLLNRTPLHKALASPNPNSRIVFTLLKNGAGIYCKDNYQKTPIDIFVKNARDRERMLFAKHVVWIIALRYRIEESLQLKLEEIPPLSEHFQKCYREVRLMKSQLIFDKFTLHDFALDCYQKRFFDSQRDATTPVLKLLLSGSYIQYLSCLVEHL